MHIYWGVAYQENLSETALEWLNNWGEIHFSFVSTQSRLGLPSPSSQATRPQQAVQPPFSAASHTMPHRFQQPSLETRPLTALSPDNGRASSATDQTVHHSQLQEQRQTYATSPHQTVQHPDERPTAIPMTPEAVVASLTRNGQNYPATNLARYERTIFLLINGKRSLVDLAQLTKRTLDEIYTTLNRLEHMQLITIGTLPPAKNK